MSSRVIVDTASRPEHGGLVSRYGIRSDRVLQSLAFSSTRPVRELPSWPDPNGVRTSSNAMSDHVGSRRGEPVPRHTHSPRPKRRSTSKPERGGSPRVRRLTAPELDAQALALREAGTSFSAVARILDLGRAVDAHRCFVRALHAHDGDDRRRLIDNEEARLDLLEERIRSRDAADASKVARRLQGVSNLREAIRL